MELKDISFESPEENILFDEVLLDLSEKNEGDEVLRFWESPQIFIVLGRISNPIDDLKGDAILQDKVAAKSFLIPYVSPTGWPARSLHSDRALARIGVAGHDTEVVEKIPIG